MSQPQQPTPEQLAAMQREMELVSQAFAGDPLLRITQRCLFIANRVSLLTVMVLRRRLQAAGVENPDIAIRAMLRDAALIDATLGPLNIEELQQQIDSSMPTYFELLAAAKVTLAELESQDERAPGT